jgi:hypothetical protein
MLTPGDVCGRRGATQPRDQNSMRLFQSYVTNPNRPEIRRDFSFAQQRSTVELLAVDGSKRKQVARQSRSVVARLVVAAIANANLVES